MVGDAFELCSQGKGRYAHGAPCTHDLVGFNGIRGLIESEQEVWIRRIQKTVKHYRVIYEDGEYGRYGYETITRLRQNALVTEAFARGARLGEPAAASDSASTHTTLPRVEVRWGNQRLSTNFMALLRMDPEEITLGDVMDLWPEDQRTLRAAMPEDTSKKPWHERQSLMLQWLRQERDEGTQAMLERLSEAGAGTQ